MTLGVITSSTTLAPKQLHPKLMTQSSVIINNTVIANETR